MGRETKTNGIQETLLSELQVAFEEIDTSEKALCERNAVVVSEAQAERETFLKMMTSGCQIAHENGRGAQSVERFGHALAVTRLAGHGERLVEKFCPRCVVAVAERGH